MTLPGLRVLALFAVGVGAACTSCSPLEPVEGSTCVDDSACQDGDVCIFGLCVDPTRQDLSQVDVEVDPRSGYPIQSVADVDLRQTRRVDVALRPGVQLQGQLLRSGAGAAGRVTALPTSSIPGRAIAAGATTDPETGDFRVDLVEEGQYTLTATADDPTAPPYYDPQPFRALGNGAGVLPVDDIEMTPNGPGVTGRVVAGTGVETQAIPGLEVVLQRADGRRVSSRGITDADGNFVVALRQAEEGLALVVRPTPENSSFPTVRIEGVAVPAEGFEAGEISLGAVSSPVRVRGLVLDAAGDPVPGADVRAQAPVGAGLFAVTTTTAADGTFDVDLLTGSYEVAVLGPVALPRGGLLTGELLAVEAARDDVVLRLPGRSPVEGVVRSAEGNPAAATALTFVRLGDSLGFRETSLGQAFRVISTVTDPSGAFTAALDPGTWRVNLEPPPGTGLPATSVVVIIEGGGQVDLVLPPPAFLAGVVVVRDGGQPVPGSLVRVYSSLVDETGAAILLGTAIAAADGSFDVVLPDLGFPDDSAN